MWYMLKLIIKTPMLTWNILHNLSSFDGSENDLTWIYSWFYSIVSYMRSSFKIKEKTYEEITQLWL